MGLELGCAGAKDLIVGYRVFVVGECKNRREIMGWMINDELSTELAVQSP